MSGNGITFTQVLSDTESPQNQCTLSLWRGMSASPSTGQITATLSGTANAAIAVAHRISGAATSGSNGAGAIGASGIANTGATDTTAPSVAITTTAANSRVYGGATHRAQAYTVGAGETAISINNSVGAAGDTTSLSTEYQDVASASSVTINGTLASATDWIQGAVEVLAAPTTITGSAALTQGADTASAAGTVAIAGDASTTQGADALAAAGTVALAGAADVTQGADTLSAAGTVAIAGDASITQGADTLSATGGVPGLSGDASITQGADTLAAAGTVAIAGAAALTQAANTPAAAGTVAIVGAAALTQGANTLAAAGALGLTFRPRTRNSYAVRAAAAATIPAVGRRFSVPADTESEQL